MYNATFYWAKNHIKRRCFPDYSWGKKDSTKRYLWSKTIQTTGSVGGPEHTRPNRIKIVHIPQIKKLNFILKFRYFMKYQE